MMENPNAKRSHNFKKQLSEIYSPTQVHYVNMAAASVNARKLFSQLIGKWSGAGTIIYPTLTEKFGNQPKPYKEEITFTDTKQPFFTYLQTTTINNNPKHSESGFIRFPKNEDKIEFVISQCTGVIEISDGLAKHIENNINNNESESKDNNSNDNALQSFEFYVQSQSISSSKFGKPPKAEGIKREFEYNGTKDELSYKVFMKTSTHKEYSLHLQCTLKRC